MTAKELLSLIQLSGERVRSNEEYLRRIQRELSANEYSYIIERIGETNRRMPTDFQDSHYYDMISGIFQILETTVSEHTILFKGIPINTKPIPIFGTVASRGYNALITPSDEPVIAFNDDLLIFTERILHILPQLTCMIHLIKEQNSVQSNVVHQLNLKSVEITSILVSDQIQVQCI